MRFRHELARNAIRSSIPIAARRRLHAEILEALLAADADPADIVHHAEAAGARGRRRRVRARRRAAGGGARVEPRGVLALPARRGLRRPAAARPSRRPCSRSWRRPPTLVGRLEDAFAAIERAIAIYGELGDEAAVGRCTRVLSRFHWFAGDGDAARAKALEAIAILEPLGESVELARAYSGVSQLAMLAEDAEQALDWGERALELAIRLGDESTRAHALVNIGSARIQLDPARPRRCSRRTPSPTRAGDRHEATRALGNLGYVLMSWVRPERGAPVRAAGARLRRGARGAHARRPTSRRRSPGSGCAPASGTRPSG